MIDVHAARHAAVRIAAATVLAVSVACASGGGAGAAAGGTSPSSSRYLLVQSDLAAANSDNVYDAIQKLRPEFLRGGTDQAGVGARTAVMVYRDGVRLSGIDDLRQILPAQIREIRYLPGPEAGVRFGTNNSAGAILIASK